MSTAMLDDRYTDEPMKDSAVGAILRAARQRRGLSLRDIGKRMGLSHSTVAHWESGYNTPPILQRVELAKILDVPFSELIPEAQADSQITVTDPDLIAALRAIERVPLDQREPLLKLLWAYTEKYGRL